MSVFDLDSLPRLVRFLTLVRQCLVLRVVEYLALVVATVRWQARLIRLLVVNMLGRPARAALGRISMQLVVLRLTRFRIRVDWGLRLTVTK